MKFALVLPPEPDESWDLARQMGVNHVITRLPETDGNRNPWDFEPLLHLTQRFEDAGFEVMALEDMIQPMDLIRLGTDPQEGYRQVKSLVRNAGAVGIPIWCYNWMAVFNWLRTSTAIPVRGGSLVTGYDHTLMEQAPPAVSEPVTEDALWKRLEEFLDEIVPVAEEADVKLALHPDDPPVSPIRGVGRIIRSVEAYERVLEYNDSVHNGVTFCQANFALMGADVPETIERFADRIHYVHFRDVEGSPEKFRETHHDTGPTNMLAAMNAYEEIDFDGPIRPDHVPTLSGEDNEVPGYEYQGRLFAIGYMRGLREKVTER
jgi:mannonate dehydratase